MPRGALIPLYAVAGVVAAVACRTALDTLPPPSPAAPAPPSAAAAAAPPPVAAAPPPAAPEPPAAATPASAPEPVSFDVSIKPLLARTCTPCHVPGGRMYERMPFDRPEVILSHKEGVLRRMKNPDDHELMARWLAQPD
jgi:hypothetical protein